MTSVTSKQLRSTWNTLHRCEGDVERQAAVLHRLFYKSKAQHRKAKWFRSIDAIRKCCRRLLSSDMVVKSSEKARLPEKIVFEGRQSHAVEIHGSLPNRLGRAERRERNEQKDRQAGARSEVEPSLFGSARVCLIDVWCAMWGDERGKRTILPKYDRIPSHEPDKDLLHRLSLSLLRLAIVLEELSFRSHVAFSTLTAQLRTPPAPTFAPLVTALVSIVGAFDQVVQTVLWKEESEEGEEAEQDGRRRSHVTNITSAYAVVRRSVAQGEGEDDESAAKAFVLDAKSFSTKPAWRSMLNSLQSSTKSGKSLQWLPTKLQRPAASKSDSLRSTAAKSIDTSPPTPLPFTPTFDALEDLGELV